MDGQYQSKIKMKELFGVHSLCNKRSDQKYYLNTLIPEDKSNYCDV